MHDYLVVISGCISRQVVHLNVHIVLIFHAALTTQKHHYLCRAIGTLPGTINSHDFFCTERALSPIGAHHQ
ncbi:MAG: hypothetical protein AB4352_02370 [Hormoscilla sp.]